MTRGRRSSSESSKQKGTNTGSLLRLFQSEFFDVHLHMHYLLSMKSGGVQDYLVNALYKMPDEDVDFYLPQLCQLALVRFDQSSLSRFLRFKASSSMYFALKICWIMQSYAEDKKSELRDDAQAMVEYCSEASVTACNDAPHTADSPAAQLASHTQSTRGAASRRASAPRASLVFLEGPTSPVHGPATTVTSPTAAVESTSDMFGAIFRRASSCPPLNTPLESTSDTCSDFSMLRRYTTGKNPLSCRHVLSDGCVGYQVDHSTTNAICSRSSANNCEEDVYSHLVDKSGSATPGHSRAKVLRRFISVSQALKADDWAAAYKLHNNLPNAFTEFGSPIFEWLVETASDVNAVDLHIHEMGQFMHKELRRGFFNSQKRLIQLTTKVTALLVAASDSKDRKTRLRCIARLINRWLLDRRVVGALVGEGFMDLLGLHIPCLRGRNYKQQIMRIFPNECKVFRSATRAPFLLVYESANLCEPPGEQSTCETLASCVVEELAAAGCILNTPEEQGGFLGLADQPLWGHLAMITSEEWLNTPPPEEFATQCVESGVIPGPSPSASPPPELSEEDAQHTAPYSPERVGEGSSLSQELPVQPTITMEMKENAQHVRENIWGESWGSRREAIKQSSPFGRYPSWALEAVVFKGGDDLRQELLASQVIRQFSAIFEEAKLPLWLKNLEVLVTSGSSGCIEFLHDSMSVTGIKKVFPDKSLGQIFHSAFADQLFKAKRNFIESYAAYALVVWFLQVKDRHNDNLMMLSSGHVVHLDFGFMLSNSPGGNMGFEQSPFKLTQEFLDVMGGEFSDDYEYFRTLVVRGFLEARKHVDRIILPVRMLLASGSKLPCFREGMDWVLQTLQDRFYINLTEEACIDKVLELIDTSVNHWRTIYYDAYQKFVHGIV